MYKERINRTEISILEAISAGPSTVTALARSMRKTKGYISKLVEHLGRMGFVEVNNRSVQIAPTPLGNEISRLIGEESIINRDMLLGGPRLKVLPLVLEPGYGARDISRRSGLSPRTVQTILGKWRQMGIVILSNRVYKLNPRLEAIISLAEKYAEHRNLSHLKAFQPDGMLLWQERDEYMFSTKNGAAETIYQAAAYTRLVELGFQLVSRNAYYFYSPIQTDISTAEAIAQGIKVDPLNPRVKGLIGKCIKGGTIARNALEMYLKKYNARLEERYYGN